MPTLTVEVEAVAVSVAVEVDAVLHQLADTVGGFTDGHLHHLAVANAVTGHQCILDVFVKRVAVVHDGRDTALGIAGGAFGGIALGEDAHFAVRSHLERKREAGNTGTNYQEINFISHKQTSIIKCKYTKNYYPRGRKLISVGAMRPSERALATRAALLLTMSSRRERSFCRS